MKNIKIKKINEIIEFGITNNGNYFVFIDQLLVFYNEDKILKIIEEYSEESSEYEWYKYNLELFDPEKKSIEKAKLTLIKVINKRKKLEKKVKEFSEEFRQNFSEEIKILKEIKEKMKEEKNKEKIKKILIDRIVNKKPTIDYSWNGSAGGEGEEENLYIGDMIFPQYGKHGSNYAYVGTTYKEVEDDEMNEFIIKLLDYLNNQIKIKILYNHHEYNNWDGQDHYNDYEEIEVEFQKNEIQDILKQINIEKIKKA